MASATLLLPARSRLAGAGLLPSVGAALARADRSQHQAGGRAQLRRHFQLIPDHWPVAALTRDLDVGDAGNQAWLRVDPAHVAPDMGGARMLSCGEALALTAEDAAQFLPQLKPVFGDAGFLLDAPQPSRWYLQLPAGARLPAFDEPDEVLGDDLFAHLPEGDLGRRWRALLNEAQVLLHNHPWNAVRVAQGKRAVNSLWFWGAGTKPDFVRTSFRQVRGSEVTLRALAKAAGIAAAGVSDQPGEVDALVDLRHLRSLDRLAEQALAPLLAAVASGELESLSLDFEDGASFRIRRSQRWRLWRRALSSLDA
ncbi:MAG TPA: phosphoglycerate mutase [Pseudoxanthomonas sp.]|nr:phosphoglycerate mutase [Pseudoxanthomonas sp.]